MQRRATWQLVVGGMALICAAWVQTDAGAQGPAPDAPSSSRVTVRSSPATTSTTCLPGRLGMTYETETTAERFVLSVHSSAPRCAPISATAVAYAMPTNGMAWPQELIEARSIRIAEGGTVEIAFERTCSPTQFDVVTGPTPERIAPWAAWHGPLLFPFDPATAFQDPGRDCDPPPPTVAPTTTPPTPTTVVWTTTVTGPNGPGGPVPEEIARNPDAPGGPDVEVLAVTTLPASDTASEAPVDPTRGASSPTMVAGLALTGATSGILVAAAVLMIVFGVGFVVGSWLRTRFRAPS